MDQKLFRIISLSIVLVFFQFVSVGQATKTITIQFKKDKLTGISGRSTYHQDFLIKVEGINTTLHKVVIKYDDFNWFTETPDALKAILPAFQSAALKTLVTQKDTVQYHKAIRYIITGIEKISTFKDSATARYSLNNPKDSIYARRIKTDMDTLETKINYFMGYYEALLEMTKSSSDPELPSLLAESRSLYDLLKKNKKNLLSGANAIIAAGKKESKPFLQSKVHTFSKQATTAKIYVIDRFDLDDTLAVYEEDIYKDGKCTLDFSTGVALNSLVKPQYYIGDNGSGKFIGNEQTRQLDFSVVALLHLNMRVCSWLSIGPATGISVSAFDANTGYIYGGSVSFGKQRSFSITAGGILGKTMALSKKISSDGTNADLALPADISSVPTYDKIGTGGFISFTYNLTRIRK